MKSLPLIFLLFINSVEARKSRGKHWATKVNRNFSESQEWKEKSKRLTTIVKSVLCHDRKQRQSKDFSISRIQNGDYNTLALLLDSQNDWFGREKYEPFAVKYRLYQGKRVLAKEWVRSLNDEGVHKRLDIDLSNLEEGEYTLSLKIFSKKVRRFWWGRRGRHVSHAKVEFERKIPVELEYLGFESDPNDPRKVALGFGNDVASEEFGHFEIVTKNIQSGEVESYVIDNYRQEDSKLLAPIFIPNPGEFKIEAVLEFTDRERSQPFTTTENFEFDLGTAKIALNISQISTNERMFLLDSTGSSPGNYGQFTQLSCLLNNPKGSFEVDLLNGPKEVNLVHSGIWAVNCTARTNIDLEASYNTSVEVKNLKPEASIANVSLIEGTLGSYLIEVSSSDPDGFVQEGTLEVSNPDSTKTVYTTLQSQEVTLVSAGTYELTYVVKDDEGAISEPAVHTIVVENKLPVAQITASTLSPYVGDPVTLSAASSYDQDGEIASYKWTYNGSFSEGSEYTVQFDSPGTKTISLQVIDNEGGVGSTTLTLNVQEKDPSDGFIEIAVNGEEVSPNHFKGGVGIHIGASDFGNGEFVYSRWELGDGEIVEDELSVFHEFSKTGLYTIKLVLGTSDGVQKTISHTIEIVSLTRTDETPSRYELVIEGIDLAGRNPIQNNITFKLSEDGVLSKDFNIRLGEDGIEENFQVQNGQLTGSFIGLEGFNIIHFYGYDQHGNFIEKSISFQAGSRNYNVEVVDLNGNPLSKFDLELRYKRGADEISIKEQTDSYGRLVLNNFPDVDTFLLGSNQNHFVNKLVVKGNNPARIVAQPVATPSEQNLKLSSGLSGWSYDPNYVNVISDNGENYISATVPEGVGTIFTHTFNSNVDGKFIFNNAKLQIVSDTHLVLVSAINHSTREINSSQVFSDAVDARPSVLASLNDLVSLEVQIIPKTETTVFFRMFQNLFSAYANSGVVVKVWISVDEYNVKIRLLDLDSEDKKGHPRNYRLGQMERISIGNYENGINHIYAHVSVRSSNLNEIKMKITDAVLTQGGNSLNILYRSLSDLSTSGGAVIHAIAHENHSRLDGEHFNRLIQLSSPNDAENIFVPFLQIENTGELFNASEPIEIAIKFQLERGIESSELREYSWKFKAKNILINHSFVNHSRHYKHSDNVNFVDNGDDWVRPVTNQVLEELLSFDPTLKFGDVSNVNGSAPEEISEHPALFAPHGWHNDGLRFDVSSPNYGEKDTPLDPGGAYYLTRLINENEIFRNRLQEKKNSIIADLDKKNEKLYKYSCLYGRTLYQVVTDRDNHKDHFHFKLTEGGDTKWTSTDDGAEGWLEYEGFVPEDPEAEELKYILQHRVYSAVPNLMYQVFYKDHRGIFNEKFTFFSDEELSSFNVDDKFIVSFVADEDPLYGPKINIEFLTENKEELEGYRVVVSGVGDLVSSGARNNCFTEEFELEGYLISDCNNDGEEGDVGIKNKTDGIVGAETKVNPDFEVSNGARVCGNTIIDTAYGFLSGGGVLLDGDTVVGDLCSDFSASGLNETKINVKDASFCTTTPGEVIIEADNSSPYPSPIYYDMVLGEEVLNKEKGSVISGAVINAASFVSRDAILENVNISNSEEVNVVGSHLQNIESLQGIVDFNRARVSDSSVDAKKLSSTYESTFIDGASIVNQSLISGTFVVIDSTDNPRRFPSGVMLDSATLSNGGDGSGELVQVRGREDAPILIRGSQVLGSAFIEGREGVATEIVDGSTVSGNATLLGGSVGGSSVVEGDAIISKGASVEGGSRVSGLVIVNDGAKVSSGANVIGGDGKPYITGISGYYYGGTATGINDIFNCTVSMHNQICRSNELEDYEF